MNNVVIRIDCEPEHSWELYGPLNDWTDYVEVDLFEKCVIYGNRDYQHHTEAKWYKKTISILKDIDMGYPKEDIINEYNLSEQLYDKIFALYDKCNHTDEIIIDVLKVLYPKKQFFKTQICGSVQREWQGVIYEEGIDKTLLEEFYFGHITEISLEIDGEYKTSTYLSNSEMFGKNASDIKKLAIDWFSLDAKEDQIEVLSSDGYVRVKKWKAVA